MRIARNPVDILELACDAPGSVGVDTPLPQVPRVEFVQVAQEPNPQCDVVAAPGFHERVWSQSAFLSDSRNEADALDLPRQQTDELEHAHVVVDRVNLGPRNRLFAALTLGVLEELAERSVTGRLRGRADGATRRNWRRCRHRRPKRPRLGRRPRRR